MTKIIRHNYLVEICNTLGLGDMTSVPLRVHGGLLHAMWRVITDKGDYAIKRLSADVDLRDKEVRQNYELTENIAYQFFKHGIPAVFALGEYEHRLLVIEKAGFLVYPWIEVGVAGTQESSSIKIAELLAKMHLIDLQVPEILEAAFVMNTNDTIIEVIKKAAACDAPFAQELSIAQDAILAMNDAYHASIPVLKEHTVVSHGDLDQKNVLWDSGTPILIDWESARKLNPTYEIINASLDWSGITSESFDKELFTKMLNAYKVVGGKINMEQVHAAFHGALGNWVNWMVYNINRAVGAQGSEQRTMGVEQVNMVLPTLLRLKDFQEYCNECNYRFV